MIVFFSLVLIVGVLRLFVDCKKKDQRILFIFICGFLLFFFSAVKSMTFTSDLKLYANLYNKFGNYSIVEIMNKILAGGNKDLVFSIFCKLFYSMGFSVRMWFMVIALVFSFGVSYFIYKYSEEPYLSFILLISLNYYYLSMTALRQATAFVFIILAWKYIVERKMWKFALMVILASMFHLSALVFLIAYPVSLIKVNKRHLVAIPLILIFSYLISPLLIKYLFDFLPRQYQGYGIASNIHTLSIAGFIIQALIFGFCYYFKSNFLEENSEYEKMFNLLLIGMVFQAFSSTFLSEMFRLSYYFSIFSIILIPNIIYNIKKEKVLIYYSVLLLSLIYIYTSSGKFITFYSFLWN